MHPVSKPVESVKLIGDGLQLESTYETGTCWGAFLTFQRLISKADANGRMLLGVCAPSNSTRTQLVSIFVHYAENHPEQLHKPFVDVALTSLAQAFPCRTGK